MPGKTNAFLFMQFS